MPWRMWSSIASYSRWWNGSYMCEPRSRSLSRSNTALSNISEPSSACSASRLCGMEATDGAGSIGEALKGRGAKAFMTSDV